MNEPKPTAIPYGYCHCGCGERTSIATKTRRYRGTTKGQPTRFLTGHGTKGTAKPPPSPASCECGCGEMVSPGCRFRHGHWARTRPTIVLADTFWAKVDIRGLDDCWPWKPFRGSGGYGLVWDPKRGRMLNAHIVAYELTHGISLEQPGRRGSEGVIVRHACDNPPCCNPAHLLTGSHQDNMDDKVARGRLPDVRGESNPKAKLSAAEIAAIRDGYTGKYGEKMAIARAYGISSGHVSKIIARDVW